MITNPNTALDRAIRKIGLTFASAHPKYDDIPEVLTRGECRALRTELDRLRAESGYFRRLLNLHPTDPIEGQGEAVYRNTRKVITNG